MLFPFHLHLPYALIKHNGGRGSGYLRTASAITELNEAINGYKGGRETSKRLVNIDIIGLRVF